MNEIHSRLEEQLKTLKLNGTLFAYKELSERATRAKLSYEEYLSLLLEEEIRGRNERSFNTRVYKARFPFVKTLEEFDFSFQPSIEEKEVLRLASLSFIENKENIIFLGPPGVGKTHLAVAFGVKGMQVQIPCGIYHCTKVTRRPKTKPKRRKPAPKAPDVF